MNILYFLIGCSVLVALVFLGAFFWALKSGQHDDVYTPSVRILFDDEVINPETVEASKNPQTAKSDNNHISD
ncbi:cbb3-type cytochrome oxidase assembly protein CcoS [Pedobacter xixiisoli]|uniref:Cytochrome oxidase maturation protein, cbb3-type n=1 Tax=Pedobacter xixiisoli TaxID=1476464 RepID=A0A285ZXY7_9SPHI|nr:cbb3-type cytochrome oxidase assembly protein CcoS [Pedobacter xixiisoli]SOD14477.1 cytochrome oxidase maturation protein, cbb3-type [Pedobacter xixiisoli]